MGGRGGWQDRRAICRDRIRTPTLPTTDARGREGYAWQGREGRKCVVHSMNWRLGIA